jgi:hypothetical protein
MHISRPDGKVAIRPSPQVHSQTWISVHVQPVPVDVYQTTLDSHFRPLPQHQSSHSHLSLQFPQLGLLVVLLFDPRLASDLVIRSRRHLPDRVAHGHGPRLQHLLV